MFKNVYDCFKHYFSLGGTIWFYSDPHFSDEESYRLRFPEEFDVDNLSDIDELTKLTVNNVTVQHLDEMQIKNINKVCGKKDTLIILGDVGNIECVRKLNAGYKVLVLGNHDSGASNYKRRKGFIDKTKKDPLTGKYVWNEKDNGLFDEIYEGKLQLSPKIVLTHIPLYDKYSLNIHGHDHNLTDFKQYVLGTYDSDMNEKQIIKNYLEAIYENNLHNLNVIAEILSYKPINLNDIVKSGILKSIPNQIDEYLENIRKEK